MRTLEMIVLSEDIQSMDWEVQRAALNVYADSRG